MFLLGSTKIVGEVNLNGMRVSALRDDEGSWEGAQGKLWLDGFTYLRFDGHAPTDARTRIAWLSKQVPEHVGKDFRTQPWEQLTMVLRAMRSEEHTPELQSRMRISYAVFCLNIIHTKH